MKHILVDINERSHDELIKELVAFRKHHPKTMIFGVNEVDTSNRYAPIHVSPVMNALRRELSDLA